MKNFKLKQLKQLTAIVLMAAIFITSLSGYTNTVSAASTSNTTTETILVTEDENGVAYTISTYMEGSNTHVVVQTDNSNDYTDMVLEGDTLIQNQYSYEGTGFFGNEKYEVNTVTTDLSSYVIDEDAAGADVFGQAISYNSKTTEKWKGNYWYQKGNNGTKIYYKIGCVATYRIRVDNNSTAKKYCEKYASSIKSCNSHYTLGTAAINGTSFSVGFICGLIIANVALPASTIVDVVVALIGGGAIITGITELVKAQSAYLNVKDYYVDARSQGTKL